MSYEVTEVRPDHPMDVEVVERVTGRTRRLTVYTGALTVAPAAGADPTDPQLVALYVPEAPALPAMVEVTTWAEVALAEVTPVGPSVAVGVADPAVELVVDEDQGGVRWLALSFTCRGGAPLVSRYRVSVMQPAG